MEETNKPVVGGTASGWNPQNNDQYDKNKILKITTIVLAAVAVVLAAVFVYVWIDRQKMIDDLTIDKENLTSQLIELQGEYSLLSSDNDSLNVQLDREREKVDQLLERIKQTDAANRSKIRQYEKELGTLRSIMKHYIYQIDSLNTLSRALPGTEQDHRRVRQARGAGLRDQGPRHQHRRYQRLQQGDRPQQPHQEAPHLPLAD